jgi:hypothetical protein
VAFLKRELWPRATVVAIASSGCSLALDTASLQSRTTGAPDASSDAPIEMDAIGDHPVCPEPGPDPCAQCQAMLCCAESIDCAQETRCNLAMVALAQCRRDARLADGSRNAIAACNTAFVQNGGPRAMTVLGCMIKNCQTTCTGA